MPTSARVRRTILLVDDEPFILAAISAMLRGAGHKVYTCGQWAEVTASVGANNPDVLLLDYNMPTLKGDDLCSILKRNSVNPDMKILLFSSEPEELLRKISGSCGADGFVKKDVPRAVLLQKIEQVLAKPSP